MLKVSVFFFVCVIYTHAVNYYMYFKLVFFMIIYLLDAHDGQV